MKVFGDTKLCVLMGDPVEHSLSPAMQNAAFGHLNLNYAYMAFRIAIENLKDALVGAKTLNILGLNITMPLKTRVIEFLDEIDQSAQSVGAVNTVLQKNGRLIGYNTDGIGALNVLESSGTEVAHGKIVILGAGGASRAVGHALGEKAEKIIIMNRTAEKARAIVEELNRIYGEKFRHGELTARCLQEELLDADVVVNATSVGMRPHENETLIGKEFLRSDLTVFDLVYNPLKTRLLQEAEAAGAKTVDGLSMLISQGALSFEIWTGRKAPIDVMRDACIKALSNKGESENHG